jgi:hypothetical protein
MIADTDKPYIFNLREALYVRMLKTENKGASQVVLSLIRLSSQVMEDVINHALSK